MMRKEEIEKLTQLHDLLQYLVNEMPGTWIEKRQKILAAGDDRDTTNLDEFVAWFDLEEGKK